MLNWTISPQTVDMAYDYGHLFKTFAPESALSGWTLAQIVEPDRVIGLLSKAERVLRCETCFEALERQYQIKRDLKVYLKLNAFDLLSQIAASSNPYGTLVGIRPVKLVHEMLRLGRNAAEIEAYLYDLYRVSGEKAALMHGIAKLEQPILEREDQDRISLYLCIPFCRTRCLYCSFPANSVSQKGHLMTRYVDCLISEIEAMTEDLKRRRLTVDCVYIGGGTPTALDETQFERVLQAVTAHFDMGLVEEFTVEAGRPDTLSDEKLNLMKRYGVGRICVNPQTMVDRTLQAIGRDHSAEAVLRLYEKARAVGFESINMDLIAGLSDEGLDDMALTVSEVLKMRPDNVTLHTLALKRASKLNEQRAETALQADETVSEMVAYATKALMSAGYAPYYMYRQKQMIGNLENIGFALPEKVCVYNVRIMEEQHSILALGAGAISKLYFPKENRLERFANTKGLEDYLNRTEEMIQKKIQWLDHYGL